MRVINSTAARASNRVFGFCPTSAGCGKLSGEVDGDSWHDIEPLADDEAAQQNAAAAAAGRNNSSGLMYGWRLTAAELLLMACID
jgi:hypothetical protein